MSTVRRDATGKWTGNCLREPSPSRLSHYVEEGHVRTAVWFRILLSVLIIQPTVSYGAAESPADTGSRQAPEPVARKSYVVDLSWSQVQRLSPGTEIMVKKPGVRQVRQRFLAAENDELKTLAVSDMAVQFAKQLRKAAAAHPDYLIRPQPSGTTIALGSHVSLKDSGVFVGEQRVAELQEFIVTISRRDIDSGSATLSTVPVERHLPLSVRVFIGVGIGLAAFAIIIRTLVPYT
jgi:hypothetical protein